VVAVPSFGNLALFLFFSAVLSASGRGLALNFRTSGGTIRGTNGIGTGFSNRMAGTGSSLSTNDPTLLLNTGSGVLRMRASAGLDFNGHVNMAGGSVVGMNLSQLGFKGNNDFVATARFINITNRHKAYDQLCLVAGSSSSNLIRAGLINFDLYYPSEADANEGFAVNTVNGVDTASRYYGAPVGTTMIVEISRTSGKWTVKVEGVDRLPNSQPNGSGTPAPPTFLDGETNLFVGVVATDIGNDSLWFAELDSFTVSVTDSTAPRVVAHWRFETGPAFTDVLHPGAAGAFNGTTPDSSGNGNSLSTWTQGGGSGYAYCSDVPFTSLPQDGATNRFSVKNTGTFPAMFTSATQSHPSGINADTMTPTQWTVEATYKPEANGGYRTVLGRDAQNVSSSDANLAALYLQIRPDDSVGVAFTDVSGYTHYAFSPPGWLYGFVYGSNPEGTNAPWYHLAAVSDGFTLKMYVDGSLVASSDIGSSGSPNRALAIGTTSGTSWTAGSWSVGRGLYGGNHTDRAYGFMDEVRICASALNAGQLLGSWRPRLEVTATTPTSMTVHVTRGQPGATCYVLQSTNIATPLARWTASALRAFDSNGTFTVVIPKAPVDAQKFIHVRAVLRSPPTGPLTYQLASGWQTWPADIRAQIMYSMDGAVALYNRYGTFNKTLTANYNPAVPTAQGSYSGWIDFGGQRNFRVAVHEASHTLGVGTGPGFCNFVSGGIWTGANGVAQIRQFDGPSASLNSDCTHIWPYGLNYDNEASTEVYRRHVFIIAALRRDMGIQ
jgi:hypothetical protein